MSTINITGTGGIIEGNLDDANVNVNLDPALVIDSSDDKITTGNLGSLGQASSISSFAWVKFAATPSTSMYIWSTLYQPCNFYMGASNKLGFQGKRASDDGTESVVMSGTYTFVTDVWYHVGFSYNNSSRAVLFYINGVEYAGGTLSGALKNVNTDLILGNYGAGSNFLNGNIADVKIFNTVVNEAGAKILASKINKDPNTTAYNSNVIGWWKINEGSSSIADFTNDTNGGTDHNGTLANGSWDYDAFSVNVQDNSTTTDGTFTVTQGKVEGKALSALEFNGSSQEIALNGNNSMAEDFTFSTWLNADEFSNNVLLGKGSNASMELRFTNATTFTANFNDAGADDITISGMSTDKWIHFAITRDRANDGTTKIYVNGVLNATADILANEPTGSFDFIGLANGNRWDGHLRDMRIYDTILFDDQISSLYSGSYPVMPYLWWKMDEGTGLPLSTGTKSITNPSDTGANAGSVDAVWDNGTLDLDGTLTIGTSGDSPIKGFLSAPRGNLQLSGNFLNYGTYTHNSGTLEITTDWRTINNATSTAATTLHNLTCTYSAQISDRTNPVVVENILSIASGKILTMRSHPSGGNAVTLTMGKSTATTVAEGGSITGAGIIDFDNTTAIATVQGASKLYPCVVDSGADWDWDSGDTGNATVVNIANLDYDPDVTTGGSGVTITLTGDCEFDAVTVSSGDTLNLNGQRAEFSNTCHINGGEMDLDGMIVMTGNGILDDDGEDTDPASLTYIQQGTATSADLPTGVGTYFYNQPSVSQTSGKAATKHIVGTGTQVFSGSPSGTDLTIATGGTIDGGSSTITCAGDFTTSGGLLGASCLKCNASSNHYASSGTINFRSDSARDYSVEFWMKPDSVTNAETDRLVHSDQKFAIWKYEDDIVFAPNYDVAFTASAVLTAGKWTHVACTWDASENALQVYIDGKLVLTGTDTTTDKTGAASIRIGRKDDGSQEYDGYMDEIRLWEDIRTEPQIRADMFQGGTLANSDNLFARWSLDEGTGTSSTDSSSNSNNLTLNDAGAWAGAGTFTYGTSTLVMSGSSKTINFIDDEELYNLTTSGTITLKGITDTADLRLNGTLNASGTLSSTASETIMLLTGSTVGIGTAGTSIQNLFKLRCRPASGTVSIPACTTKTITCETNSTTTQATGDLTITTELDVSGSHTFNANGNTITAHEVDCNGSATLDLRNSTLSFSRSSGYTWNNDSTVTLLSGNTTVIGRSTSEHANCYLPSAGGFEIVGDVKWLEIQSGGDLTVVGSVTDCSFANSTANIRQWHHTLDTQQLLDADSDGDDDLRLTKPALDNSHELMTS